MIWKDINAASSSSSVTHIQAQCVFLDCDICCSALQIKQIRWRGFVPASQSPPSLEKCSGGEKTQLSSHWTKYKTESCQTRVLVGSGGDLQHQESNEPPKTSEVRPPFQPDVLERGALSSATHFTVCKLRADRERIHNLQYLEKTRSVTHYH